MTSGATSRVTSCATCRGTQTRGVGEVVDASGATSRVTCRGTRTRDIGEVVDDERCHEPRDKPRNVLSHLNARHR
jgi:hypothetical protein